MAITMIQPGQTVPPRRNPKDEKETPQSIQKKVKDLQMKKKVLEQKSQLQKQEQELDQKSKALTKDAAFICALRLDMVADKLQKINPRWAEELDNIADSVENARLKSDEEEEQI